MSIEILTSEIKEISAGYQPGPETAEQLRQTTLVPLIGPMAVGKTTCMEALDNRYDDFCKVQGFTTRPLRNGEDPDTYRFIPHTEERLEKILDSLQNGKMVQATVHPTTSHVYGTETADYQQPYSVLDTLYSAMDDIRGLPFGDMREIGLVTFPGMWWRRVIERANVNDRSELDKRVSEGEASLKWLLDQGESIAWVINEDNKLHKTIDEIFEIARGNREPHPSSYKAGEQLLQSISRHWSKTMQTSFELRQMEHTQA